MLALDLANSVQIVGEYFPGKRRQYRRARYNGRSRNARLPRDVGTLYCLFFATCQPMIIHFAYEDNVRSAGLAPSFKRRTDIRTE